jgi:hypothetical protein
MNSKKIFSIFLLIIVAVLISGTALAATPQKPTSPLNYTDAQKACIKAAQNKRVAATKPAMETFNAATKDALTVRQEAMKKAQEIKDAKTKMAAIKSAIDVYNNDAVVKVAKIPYMAAIKEASVQFQADQNSCLSGSDNVGFFHNIFKNITAALSASSEQDSSLTAQSPSSTAIKYTDEQKVCIKTVQDKRVANIKAAAEALKSQTGAALKTRQDAMLFAQKIKDEKARAKAIKSANETYNNDATVKQAKPAYVSAVKAANDQFQIDQKVCLAGSPASSKSFFKKMGDGFSSFGNGFMKLFNGKK